jgi:hypothetical protein
MRGSREAEEPAPLQSISELLQLALVKRYWVYIVSNKSRRLYTGLLMTSSGA